MLLEEDTISRRRIETITRKRMLAQACGRVTVATGKVDTSVKRDILLHLGIVVEDKEEE